jgi:hypothetical protein
LGFGRVWNGDAPLRRPSRDAPLPRRTLADGSIGDF